MSVPIATCDDRREPEDNKTTKKHKKDVVYYPIDPFNFCQRCVDMEERVPEKMPDQDEYQFIYFKDDEELNLRIAHYYKKLLQNGGFEIDCPPSSAGYPPAGFLLNKEHFVNYPNYKTMYDASIKAGIDEYIDVTGNQMTFVDTENVTVGIVGCNMIFFLTMKCSLVEKGTICNVSSESSNPVVDSYQSVVSYDEPTKTCGVWIFRRKSDGEDLIEPDPKFASITRPEKPVPQATKRFMRGLIP